MTSPGGQSAPPAPPLAGIHHVTIPVTDVPPAVEWFVAVFGFEPCVTFEEEDGVSAVLLEHPCGIALLLRADPAPASSAYPALTFTVSSLDNLRQWEAHLTVLGVPHTEIAPAHLGWEVTLGGPEGMALRLTTSMPLDGVALE